MHNRFGLAASSQPIEASILWAAEHNFGYVDFQADLPPNHLTSFDQTRVRDIRDLCERHQIKLGIHPSSAINNAEDVPILAEAVDQYLLANLDLAVRLGCEWFVGHGGYHFGDLQSRRRSAAIERMKRLLTQAEKVGVTIYFENHNKEPAHSEMHYLPHNVEETRWFFNELQSPYFKWAFNVAHGHLVPEGWTGFLDAFGVENIGQVRINDNKGDYEVHLVPGEGTIDFVALFTQLKQRGYDGQLNLGFGTEADKLRVRDWFMTLL